MKRYIFLFVVVVMTACSSDDNKEVVDYGENIPAEEKFLEGFTVTNSTLKFLYNTDKTVKRMTIAANDSSMAYIFDFKYAGGNISQITGIVGGTSGTILFEHQNNIITGYRFENDDQVTPVQYNAQTNAYSFVNDNEDYLIDLTSWGDMEKYYTSDEYTSDYNCVLLYSEDSDKFGTMYNTNNIHPYMVMLFPQLTTILALLSRKPAETLAISDAALFLENQHYNDGFIKSSVLSFEEGTETYNFKYISLKDN